jgi:2-phosphoglycolate phosphatase
MSIGGVVFDLDGTLVDSRGDIAEAANATLRTYGRPVLPFATITGWVGDGARALVARLFGIEPDRPEIAEYLLTYLDYYAAHPTETSRLLPGAREALDALVDWPLAVCTNKPRRITDLVLRNLGIEGRFQVVVGGGDVRHPKPHPESLWSVARALGAEPHALVVVGDGPQDVECGHAVGARTVGITGGFLPEARLLEAKPDAVLNSLFQLPGLIRDWTNASG